MQSENLLNLNKQQERGIRACRKQTREFKELTNDNVDNVSFNACSESESFGVWER